jgi:hypothetical protein
MPSMQQSMPQPKSGITNQCRKSGDASRAIVRIPRQTAAGTQIRVAKLESGVSSLVSIRVQLKFAPKSRSGTPGVVRVDTWHGCPGSSLAGTGARLARPRPGSVSSPRSQVVAKSLFSLLGPLGRSSLTTLV